MISHTFNTIHLHVGQNLFAHGTWAYEGKSGTMTRHTGEKYAYRNEFAPKQEHDSHVLHGSSIRHQNTKSQAFRNEIAPKQGLLRLREFEMAEIEHFLPYGSSSHANFELVAESELLFWSAAAQEQGANERGCKECVCVRI